MKPVAVVAMSIVVLAGSVAGAESRGLRLRGSGLSLPHRSSASHASTTRGIAAVGGIGLFDPVRGDTNIVTRSVTSAAAQGADETAPIPPMPPMPTVRKPAEPWCPSGRIAGGGQGFCLIN